MIGPGLSLLYLAMCLHIYLQGQMLQTKEVPEICVLRKVKQDLLERTEMKMLRWMMGIKRIEKIRTEEIRARTDVANIS